MYSAPDDTPLSPSNRRMNENNPVQAQLENFSEKAIMVFEQMSAGLDSEKKEALAQELNSIGKAAAFASTNGFESLSERTIVAQHFERLSGVISDDAIKKMIFTKLNNPAFEEREFFEAFANALEEPLAHINIRV